MLVRFLQVALIILVLLHTLRNFGLSGSTYKWCAFPTPLLVEVLESCLRALPSRWKLLRPLNCQRTPPTIPAGHATALPVPHRPLCSQFFFCSGLAPSPHGVLLLLRVFAGFGRRIIAH